LSKKRSIDVIGYRLLVIRKETPYFFTKNQGTVSMVQRAKDQRTDGRGRRTEIRKEKIGKREGEEIGVSLFNQLNQ